MLDVYPSALNKPSALVDLPDRFIRPAFEVLYGFDVPEDLTVLAEPGLYSEIILTTPDIGTIRHATDIQALMVYDGADWQVYYSTHNYNFLVTSWEDFSTSTWNNMT